MKKFIGYFTAFLMSVGLTAFGQLKWEKPTQDFKPSLNDAKVVAHFAFKNEGAYTVAIKDLQTSCGCTTANLDKKVYRTGETGDVEAVFNIGNHQGTESKTIAVQTDDEKNPISVLTMNVTIPEVANIQPNVLAWSTEDKPTTKEFRITLGKEYLFKTIQLISDGNEDYKFELNTINDKSVYSVLVTPTAIKSTSTARLLLLNKGEPNEKSITLVAYTQYVRKPDSP